MTDFVEYSSGNTSTSRANRVSTRYAGASDGGWVQPSSSRLMEDPEGNVSAGALNAFGESHSASSFDVTIDTGEALVGGTYLVRDTQTTVTLAASTNNQSVYVGVKDSAEDTVIIGLSGDFTSDDPKHEIWQFDTDGSGVTSATDQRNLDSFRVRNEDIQGLRNFTSDEVFSQHPIALSDIDGSGGTDGQLLASDGTDGNWADGKTDASAWSDVTGSRSGGTWFQNTTGTMLAIIGSVQEDASSRSNATVHVNSSQSDNEIGRWLAGDIGAEMGFFALVPDTHYYKVVVGADKSIHQWNETQVTSLA